MTTPRPGEVTPAEEYPAIEQALYADQFEQTDPTQQSEPLDQTSSSLPEQDPSIVTTPRLGEVTPAEEYPVIEQAFYAEQFEQTDPTQQSAPLDQTSSSLPEPDPSIVTTPQPGHVPRQAQVPLIAPASSL